MYQFLQVKIKSIDDDTFWKGEKKSYYKKETFWSLMEQEVKIVSKWIQWKMMGIKQNLPSIVGACGKELWSKCVFPIVKENKDGGKAPQLSGSQN